jgi:hypothetical protein
MAVNPVILLILSLPEGGPDGPSQRLERGAPGKGSKDPAHEENLGVRQALTRFISGSYMGLRETAAG